MGSRFYLFVILFHVLASLHAQPRLDEFAFPDSVVCTRFHIGLAIGLYSGITYGLQEARGAYDWKNSVVAGALTGAALVLTCEDASHEQVIHYAITGAALSTAVNLLAGVLTNWASEFLWERR
ncbi:outer envelope pore protein 16-2, chloroplastic-like isoform X2 [Magnolia sinica]|uniref:outer envelope pore protein 16-2, chloroplastic-like isoform X2 n=1 Tax=Magnolia sinica TaxID=86752 RepID=UPI00265A6EDC|nr:outer envelope pore protein 16-2, chloroplastic-like isoform X2 [Magnolia sinica]